MGGRTNRIERENVIGKEGAETRRTASTEVFVPHPRLALDVQRPPQPFGGEVDVSGPAERSASNKEHLLLLDPRNELVRYVVVELAHPG